MIVIKQRFSIKYGRRSKASTVIKCLPLWPDIFPSNHFSFRQGKLFHGIVKTQAWMKYAVNWNSTTPFHSISNIAWCNSFSCMHWPTIYDIYNICTMGNKFMVLLWARLKYHLLISQFTVHIEACSEMLGNILRMLNRIIELKIHWKENYIASGLVQVIPCRRTCSKPLGSDILRRKHWYRPGN